MGSLFIDARTMGGATLSPPSLHPSIARSLSALVLLLLVLLLLWQVTNVETHFLIMFQRHVLMRLFVSSFYPLAF